MVTRFSILTCPNCKHEGKPELRGKSRSLLEALPHIGTVLAANRETSYALHCAQCGFQFTESIQQKVQQQVKEAPAKARSLLEKATAAAVTAAEAVSSVPKRFCTECGAEQLIEAKFCHKCGMAKQS